MIPVVGWIFSFVFNASLAVPFWFFWTKCGIGVKFFSFLPGIYTSIGFWDSVMLFVCIGIIKAVLFPSFGSAVINKPD